MGKITNTSEILIHNSSKSWVSIFDLRELLLNFLTLISLFKQKEKPIFQGKFLLLKLFEEKKN